MLVYVVCLSWLLHTDEMKNAETAKVVKCNIYSGRQGVFHPLPRPIRWRIKKNYYNEVQKYCLCYKSQLMNTRSVVLYSLEQCDQQIIILKNSL